MHGLGEKALEELSYRLPKVWEDEDDDDDDDENTDNDDTSTSNAS